MKNIKYIDEENNNASWLDAIVSEGSEKSCHATAASPINRAKKSIASELVSIGYKLTEEHKNKIGASNKGVSRKTSWLGRRHSEETKAKLSQINKNRPKREEFSAEKKAEISRKISESKKGKKRDQATIDKIRKAKAAHGPYKRSEEAKAKVAAALRGRKRDPKIGAKVGAKVAKPLLTPLGLFPSRVAALKKYLEIGYSIGAFNKLLYKDKVFTYLEKGSFA